jgi:hypothetical protein
VQFVENTIKKAKIKFETERVKFEKSSEVYNAMQTVLAWTTIYDPNNNRIINPVSRTFSPDWVLFGWDTYFAAYMLSLNNKQLAYANAIAITKEITAKGFIPNYIKGSIPAQKNSRGFWIGEDLTKEQQADNEKFGLQKDQSRSDKKTLANIRKKAEVDTSPIDANKILGDQMPRIFTPLESGRVSKTIAKGSKLGYPDLDTKFNFEKDIYSQEFI